MLHFLSSHFSFQPNKRVFYPPTFPPLQPNTHEGKINIFYPPTFPSSYFSTPPTKQTLRSSQNPSHFPFPTKQLKTSPISLSPFSILPRITPTKQVVNQQKRTLVDHFYIRSWTWLRFLPKLAFIFHMHRVIELSLAVCDCS